MKRLFFLILFLTFVFNSNAQYYDYKAKVDINAALQTTDLNDIYNQVGSTYLGYGHYLIVCINPYGDYFCPKEPNRYKGYSERVESSRVRFSDNGRRKTLVKTVYYFYGNDGLPIMKRSEAIDLAKELNELIELGLISQEKYDYEINRIKGYLERN